MHTYQKVFYRQEVPRGTLIFTDFDHLHTYEIDAATEMARAAIAADPKVRIINPPSRACERFRLLDRLHSTGLNPVEVTRLESGLIPTRYPLFIRSEDGCAGPETGLIADADAYRAAVAHLSEIGQTLKRRIALSYVTVPDAEGFFRKYGAFVIGDHIIPQHILRSGNWNVKSSSGNRSAAFALEEVAFVHDNPHAGPLREIAAAAGIEFGRIDYTMLDSKPVIFEINTNPTFPSFRWGDQSRQQRREIILSRLVAAFAAIDTPDAGRGTIPFSLAAVGNHEFIEREFWYQDLPRSVIRRKFWRELFKQAMAQKGAKQHARMLADRAQNLGGE